jgi:hypothetical protein
MNEVLLSSILCKFFSIGGHIRITNQVSIKVDGLSKEDIEFIKIMLKPL